MEQQLKSAVDIAQKSGNKELAVTLTQLAQLLSASNTAALNLGQLRPLLYSSIPMLKSNTLLLQSLMANLSAHEVSLPDIMCLLRENIAAGLEDGENWTESARMLMAMPLDNLHLGGSGTLTMSGLGKNLGMGALESESEYKVAVWLKITRLLLEDDDDVGAESYLNRASTLIRDFQNPLLQLTFRVCHAQALNYKRKFVEAAHRYHDLSFQMMNPEERVHALQQAIICAILANPSGQRTRMLAALVKDDRVEKQCSSVVAGLLERVFNEQLLEPGHVKSFADLLMPHQLASLPDGSTVLDRSVLEHNLSALSKLFSTVRVKDLGVMLGLEDEVKVEQVCARMFGEGRLQGFIDQCERMVYFEPRNAFDVWNERINQACLHLDSIHEQLIA